MATVYGGDEVSALVVDIGSNSTKVGYAGEDSPKAVFPSAVGVIYSSAKDGAGGKASGIGDADDVDMEKPFASASNTGKKYYVGTNSIGLRREGLEIENALAGGLVRDWDIVERLLEHGLKKRLGVDCKQHPVLLAEATFNTRELREKATEVMFEKYQAPALFLAKNGVLSAFASGRSSGLVLDSGGGITCAVAVHDGYALNKSIVKSTIAGDFLTRELYRFYQHKEVQIHPRYCLQKREVKEGQFEVSVLDFPGITKSYHEYMIHEIVRDIKESTVTVSETTFDKDLNIPSVQYELPDGKILEVGAERFRMGEYLFAPEQAEFFDRPTGEIMGYHQMINTCIRNADPDIRRDLYSGIILTGGNTLFAGFQNRLTKELTEISPQRFKIIATNFPAERKFSVWIGGSILGSLGTFQQMWMSKAEYEEHGAGLVERKCP